MTTSSSSPDFKKFCVFCGNAPRDKTKEHVLPQWLIALTGDPNREANFHVEFGAPPKMKRFAFDQFTLPACSDCNKAFARLEAQVEPVVRAILNNESLDEEDWSVLLSWFDKVRVGLWLSKYFLSKNSFGIKPKFQIQQRIDVRDRALVLFRRKSVIPTLTIIGNFLPSFDFSPTSFALVVNGYMFINLTSPDLCSHRLGFPSLKQVRTEGDLTIVECLPGPKRVMSPVLRNFTHLRGTGVYQPIYWNVLQGTAECKDLLINPYVAHNSLDQKRGIGGVFLQQEGKAERLPKGKSKTWIPALQLTNPQLIQIAHHQVYEHQIAEMQEAMRIGPPEQKKFWRDQISGCRRAMTAMLKRTPVF